MVMRGYSQRQLKNWSLSWKIYHFSIAEFEVSVYSIYYEIWIIFKGSQACLYYIIHKIRKKNTPPNFYILHLYNCMDNTHTQIIK